MVCWCRRGVAEAGADVGEGGESAAFGGAVVFAVLFDAVYVGKEEVDRGWESEFDLPSEAKPPGQPRRANMHVDCAMA